MKENALNYLDDPAPLFRKAFVAKKMLAQQLCLLPQSDCPAREKFGYGGDLNAISESYIYSFDMQDFYRKTIYDWVDAMNDSVFVDTAPYVGIRYCGISWESAYLTTQYFLSTCECRVSFTFWKDCLELEQGIIR